MATLISFFQSGGAFMYPILAILALGTAIVLDRWIFITRARVNGAALWNEVQGHIEILKRYC